MRKGSRHFRPERLGSAQEQELPCMMKDVIVGKGR